MNIDTAARKIAAPLMALSLTLGLPLASAASSLNGFYQLRKDCSASNGQYAYDYEPERTEKTFDLKIKLNPDPEIFRDEGRIPVEAIAISEESGDAIFYTGSVILTDLARSFYEPAAVRFQLSLRRCYDLHEHALSVSTSEILMLQGSRKKLSGYADILQIVDDSEILEQCFVWLERTKKDSVRSKLGMVSVNTEFCPDED